MIISTLSQPDSTTFFLFFISAHHFLFDSVNKLALSVLERMLNLSTSSSSSSSYIIQFLVLRFANDLDHRKIPPPK